MRVVDLVEVADSRDPAIHVDGDGRDVLTAEGPDLARLAHRSGKEPSEEGVLVRLVEQGVDVLDRRRVAVVDDREVLARVGLCRRLGGIAHQEADGDDDSAVVADERGDVRHVVTRRGRRQVTDRHRRVHLLRGLKSSPRGGVERTVVDAARVGHLAGEERALVTDDRRSAVTCNLSGGGDAGRDDAREERERREDDNGPHPRHPPVATRLDQRITEAMNKHKPSLNWFLVCAVRSRLIGGRLPICP